MADDERSAALAAADRSVLAQEILDSLDAQLAVIDQDGIIRHVNAAWVKSAVEDGADPAAMGVGVDYLSVCEPDVLAGVRAVLNGESDYFETEYECGTPTEERWYSMRVVPLSGEPPRRAVITHHNITRRKRTERQQAQARVQASLDNLTLPRPTETTAQTFGLRPLRDSAPDIFERLVRRYADLLDQAVRLRVYKGEPPLPPRLQELAENLVFLKAGPRDVIDLHIAALQQKSTQTPVNAAQAYAEEARLLILELMGHLAVAYRNSAFGIKPTSADARSA